MTDITFERAIQHIIDLNEEIRAVKILMERIERCDVRIPSQMKAFPKWAVAKDSKTKLTL